MENCKCEGVNCLNVKIKKLQQDAVIPSYAKFGDAGMDMTAVKVNQTDDYIEYETGISIEIPVGYAGLLFPRSSNSKKDLLLCNSIGLIDSGYRGPINFRYKRINNPITDTIEVYSVGDRVGQIVILPYPQITFIEVDELSTTERGEGGFGSTNK